MAAFSYIAINPDGKRLKGVQEGDTERQVREALRAKKLTVVNVERVSEKKAKKRQPLFSRNKIGYAELTLITRQMATLLSAGMPIDEVLSGVAEQTDRPQTKSVLLGVRAKVLEGHSIASALNEFPSTFSALYRMTVESGEKSGKLDHVLLRLADYTEKQQRIKQKVKQALVYPSLMTVVSIGVVIFLLVYVVPKIVHVFSQTHQVLPMVTIVLLSISGFLRRYGYYFLASLVALGYFFKRAMHKLAFRTKFYKWVLKLPVMGNAMRTVNAARFARTFGILNSATVPVLDAMKTAAELIVPPHMQKAVLHAVDRVREGVPIHRALKDTHMFSPMMIHLIASGEASGTLDDMLEKAADHQDEQVETLIQGALTLFEPVMILLMGAVVLFIVLAVMLPIFDLDSFGG